MLVSINRLGAAGWEDLEVEYDASAVGRFFRTVEACRRENLIVEGFACGIVAQFSLLASHSPMPQLAKFFASDSSQPVRFADIPLFADLNLERTEIRPLLDAAQCIALRDDVRRNLVLRLMTYAKGEIPTKETR